jgi:hypothetical protein
VFFFTDIYNMDRIRWSEKAIPFRSLVDNPSIPKPALGKYFLDTIFEKINCPFFSSTN